MWNWASPSSLDISFLTQKGGETSLILSTLPDLPCCGVPSSERYFSLQPLDVLGAYTCHADISDRPGAPSYCRCFCWVVSPADWGRQCFGFTFMGFKCWWFCHGDSDNKFKRHQNNPFVFLMAVWNLAGNLNIFRNGLLWVPWNRNLQALFKYKWSDKGRITVDYLCA